MARNIEMRERVAGSFSHADSLLYPKTHINMVEGLLTNGKLTLSLLPVTYETIVNVDLVRDRVNDLEIFKDITVPATYETKIDVISKLALKVDKTQNIMGLDFQDNITRTEVVNAIGEATQIISGVMSTTDKQRLDALHAMLGVTADADNVVNTINEIMAIFATYPEGADILTALAGKVDKVADKQLSTNDLTDTLKDYYDTAYAHSQIVGKNPHQTTYAQLLNKPTTVEQAGILNVYNKEYIDALKDKNGWESELLGTLSNNGTIALAIINQYDEIQMYAKDALGVIDNENIRPSLMQSGDSVYFFGNTQAFIMVDTVFGFYAPVDYTLQVVGLKYTDFKAEEVSTNEVGVTVQDKLDEIDKNKVEKAETRNVGVETIIYENGKLTSVVSDNVSTYLAYDQNGNIQKITETYADGKSYETTYTKDVEGRIKTMTKAEV